MASVAAPPLSAAPATPCGQGQGILEAIGAGSLQLQDGLQIGTSSRLGRQRLAQAGQLALGPGSAFVRGEEIGKVSVVRLGCTVLPLLMSRLMHSAGTVPALFTSRLPHCAVHGHEQAPIVAPPGADLPSSDRARRPSSDSPSCGAASASFSQIAPLP
jgi:hypothetical protein